MGMLKKDTTPLSKEDLIKIKYKLPPYEYTIVEAGGERVFVLRSGRSVPDLINDLEMFVEKLDERELELASQACMVGEEESVNISLSVLWSLIEMRRKNDTRLVGELRARVNRNFGHLLFRSEDDPQGIYRLAIRVPYSIVDVKEDTLGAIFEGIDVPQEGEIVYVISDDGHLRMRASRFFEIISEKSGIGPATMGHVEAGSGQEIEGLEPSLEIGSEPQAIEDEDGFEESFQDESPLETMVEYMPKLTYGAKTQALEPMDRDTGMSGEDEELESMAFDEGGEAVDSGGEEVAEVREDVEEVREDVHEEVAEGAGMGVMAEEEGAGGDAERVGGAVAKVDLKEAAYSGLVASGLIVERKAGVMDLDFLVQWRPRIEAPPRLFVARVLERWSEGDARLLEGYVRGYNAEGGLLIGNDFPVDVRLFVVGRPLYMVDLDVVLSGRLDMSEIIY